MSADIFEATDAADAAAWYAAEHQRALHDADALHGADDLTARATTGSSRWWHRRIAVMRLRRRARLAGHLAAQARADHERLLGLLIQQVEEPEGTPPRVDLGAELMDRLTDALHAHYLAVREVAHHNNATAATRWWQPIRRELALLRADYAEDCMAAQWERIQQVRAEIVHHVRARLPR